MVEYNKRNFWRNDVTRVKSFAKIIIALLMAFALTTLTACDMLDDFFGKGDGNGGTGDGNVYQVVFENNGGTFTDSFTEYTSGTAKNLPANGSKEHYVFDGWYANSDFYGNAASKIPAGATGDKTYYAKWTPETYNLTFSINGDSSYTSPVTSYAYGTACALPVPMKSGSNFNGWYTQSNLGGSKITEIFVGEYGDKAFYGEWVNQGTPVTTYSVTLNANGGTIQGVLTEYTAGIATTLPGITKTGYEFEGWYENSSFSGSAVTQIPANATGDKQFWAKWRKLSVSSELNITAYGGYEEGAYVEFDTVSGVSDYTVKYKKSGSSSYTAIDEEIVRVNTDDGTVRADVVGISKGEYSLQVIAGGKSKEVAVTVTEYDRSVYAHFNYTNGVGAYKDDGTPKSNAVIVYVNEATKNTASAKIGSKTYRGISNILNAATSSSTPVIMRILGRIAAPTWEHNGDQPMIKYTKAGDKLTSSEAIKQTKDKFGITLGTGSYKQSDLTKLNFKLEEGITALNGLTSTMTLGSDCRWNDMSIGGSSSKPTNITVEGIGTDAEIFQWGLTWNYANSVEIRNITFDDYTEDACSFQGNTKAGSDTAQFNSSRIWIHNCTFNEGKNYWDTSDDQDKGEGDGATDFKSASNITVSYNRYYYNHKTGLVGSGADSYTSNVTFHHNFYDQNNSRLPMVRQANVHMYNNYYRATRSYCLSARNNMYAFVEACYFENCNDTIRTETDAVVKLYNCKFVGKTYDSGYAITKATTRGQIVNNANFMNPSKQTSGYSIDNDSSLFYLNNDGTTKVTRLDVADEAKWECVNFAGVHKSSGWTKITTDTQLNNVYPLVNK